MVDTAPPIYPTFVESHADRTAYDVARAGGWDKWVRNKYDLRAIENGCYFSEKKALHVKAFIETFLRIDPDTALSLLPWQYDSWIAPVFGWRRKNGKRRFRTAYLEIPKNNGKSLICSAIALYMLVGDKKPKAEVFIAGVDREQCEQVYKECSLMAEYHPVLRQRLKVVSSKKRIILKGKTGVPLGKLRTLSKDNKNSQGVKAHALIMEELHTWTDREQFGSLLYATKKTDLNNAGDTSLTVMITTAGIGRVGVGWEQHETARKYMEGVLPHSGYEDYYGIIFAAPANADIYDPATHALANPGYGKTVDPEEIKSSAEKCRTSKAEELIFRRYRLNQWVSGSITGWLNMKQWGVCKPRAEIRDLVGKECYAGFDLSSTKDLTAFVLAFPDGEGGYHVFPWFWVPEDTIVERTQRENVPYLQWKEEEFIESTPGNVVDYQYIRARINEIGEQFNIRDLALDRLWQGQALCNDLVADGFNVVPFGQGFTSMGPPSKIFEVLLGKGLIRHGDNPVLAWCAGNCVAETDVTDMVKPSKKKSTEKIDGIVASIMAIGRASVAPRIDDSIGYMTPQPEPEPK